MESKSGKVYLVGAGPGDEELLSMKARRLFEKADVFLYDALVSTEILSMIPEEKQVIYVGKRMGNHARSQEEIEEILCREAEKGNIVVRLKGGDPFVFGRGGEEAETLVRRGIPFEVVPGVTSAIAALAYAGIPVTHRELVSSFHVVTAHRRKEKEEKIEYEALVRTNGTLIFLMGVSAIKEITEGLLAAGMEDSMPAAVVERGTTSSQKTLLSTVGRLAKEAKQEQIQSPALIVVGEVCQMAGMISWSEKRRLGGKKILVTRPRKRNESLCNRLRDLGAQVIEFPTIFLQPAPFQLTEGKTGEEIKVRNSQGRRWYVFTSPEGVEVFFAQLASQKKDIRAVWRPQDAIAVIGSGTAKELEKRGFFPDLMPKEFYTKDLGECLASHVKEGESVILLRAREGSLELLLPLKEKGIPVIDVPLYDTILGGKAWLAPRILRELQEGAIDCVTFTSASTVKGFVKSFPDLDFSTIRAVCIGHKTKEEAEWYGFLAVAARETTVEAVIEKILEI